MSEMRSSLPVGYIQAAYIQSSGTQYIDTGFVPDQDTRLVMDVHPIYEGTDFKALFGARTSTETDAFGMWFKETTMYPQYGDVRYSAHSLAVNPAQRLSISMGDGSAVVNDVSTALTDSGSFSSRYPLALLSLNDAGTVDTRMVAAKLYACQIYANSTLVRDFVPCVRASDGTAGLYDTVGGTFYASASADAFTAGASVAESIPLPDDCEEIEYIASTGTQYIDTGFVPDQRTGMVLDAQIDAGTTTESHLASLRQSGSGPYMTFYTSGGKVSARWASQAVKSFGSKAIYDRHTFEWDRNTATFDGETLTWSEAVFSFTYAMPLFCRRTAGTIDGYIKAKLWSCRIWSGGILVRDFIPCIDADGTAGLWDAVTGTMYKNAGTGAFTAGPLLHPTPDAPSDLAADVRNGAVTLSWTSSDDAEGYRITRDGILIGETAQTSFTDSETDAYGMYLYTVTAYNAHGEGDAAQVRIFVPGSRDVLNDLITDRTAADVSGHTKKGVYNAPDLNRVSSAAGYVRSLLTKYGYLCGQNARADWETNEIPRTSALDAHHFSVTALDVIRYARDPVRLPLSMEKLTWEDANAMEAFLLSCGRAAERIPEAWVYCAETECGGI